MGVSGEASLKGWLPRVSVSEAGPSGPRQLPAATMGTVAPSATLEFYQSVHCPLLPQAKPSLWGGPGTALRIAPLGPLDDAGCPVPSA